DQLLGEVDRDHRLAAAAMALRIGAEARQVDDRVFGHEAAEFARLGPDQHRADEEIVPGQLVDHAHVDAVLGLRAAVQILHEQRVASRQLCEEIGLQRGEMLGGHALVDIAPPDIVFGGRVADDELVLGRTAGVLAGGGDQRAVLRQLALAAAHRVLHERGGLEVPDNIGTRPDAHGIETMARRALGQISLRLQVLARIVALRCNNIARPWTSAGRGST
ncbi:hypothetical protein QU38_02720, partial [Staphylococcus aureus]